MEEVHRKGGKRRNMRGRAGMGRALFWLSVLFQITAWSVTRTTSCSSSTLCVEHSICTTRENRFLANNPPRLPAPPNHTDEPAPAYKLKQKRPLSVESYKKETRRRDGASRSNRDDETAEHVQPASLLRSEQAVTDQRKKDRLALRELPFLPPEIMARISSFFEPDHADDLDWLNIFRMTQGQSLARQVPINMPYSGVLTMADYYRFSPLEHAIWAGRFGALLDDDVCRPNKVPLPTVHASVIYLVVNYDLKRRTATATAALQRCVAVPLKTVAPNLTIQVIAAAMGRIDIALDARNHASQEYPADGTHALRFDVRLLRYVPAWNRNSDILSFRAVIRMKQPTALNALQGYIAAKVEDIQPFLHASRYNAPQILDQYTHLAGIYQWEMAPSIDAAAMRGHFAILDWWQNRAITIKYSDVAIGAAKNTAVLDWFATAVDQFASKLPCEVLTQYARDNRTDLLHWWSDRPDGLKAIGSCFARMRRNFLNAAVEHEHLDVLAWALNHRRNGTWMVGSPTSLTMSETVWTAICRGQRMHVAKWWVEQSGIALVDQIFPRKALFDALEAGDLRALQWMAKLGVLDRVDGTPSSIVFDRVFTNGHLQALDWYMQHTRLRNVVDFTPHALVCASRHGDVKAIKWFFENRFTVSEWGMTKAIDSAAAFGQMEVLYYFAFHADQTFRPSHAAVDEASANGHLHVLEFFSQFPWLPMRYSTRALDEATARGHIRIVSWWFHTMRSSSNGLKYSAKAVDGASQRGKVEMLDLWYKSGLEMRYSTESLDSFPLHLDDQRIIRVLGWWQRSGLSMKYTERSMDEASISGRVAVLAWWLERVPRQYLRYSRRAMDETRYKHVLHWWKSSGLPLKYTRHVVVSSPSDMASLTPDPFGPTETPVLRTLPVYDDILQWWADEDLREYGVAETTQRSSMLPHVSLANLPSL